MLPKLSGDDSAVKRLRELQSNNGMHATAFSGA